MITAERLRELVTYDPKTGVFTRLTDARPRWKAGQETGWKHKHNRYVYVRADGKAYFAHRLAWLYMTGEWPEHDIDHIDGQIDNNAFANLRQVSETVNAQNQRRAHKGAKSGLLGVYPSGLRWRAMITVNKKTFYLGLFDKPEEAYDAYLTAKRISHPGCTI